MVYLVLNRTLGYQMNISAKLQVRASEFITSSS